MTRIALGVDAGASKTHAVLTDETGRVLGVGRSGTANWEIVGLDGAQAALRQAVEQALAMAHIASKHISAACYGLAGLDWPSDETRLTPVIASLGLGGTFKMYNDAFLPLRAGTPDGVGLAAIAGSGTCVAGRNRQGRTARSLGGGYPLTDWGGAWDIVRAAIYAATRAYMGMGPRTILTDYLLEATGCADMPTLLEGLMRDQVELHGDFAPTVARAADEGDEAARAIFRKAGRRIGENVISIARRLDMLEETFTLVTAGGVFSSHNRDMNESLLNTVRRAAVGVRLHHWDAPPVVGAVLMAMDMLHLENVPEPSALAQAISAALKRVV